MHLINFYAPVLSGKSAAGFEIGMDIVDLSQILGSGRSVTYQPGFNLVHAIRGNRGVLCVRGLGDGTVIYFGPSTVRLSFSNAGILGCIYVNNGYIGGYNGVKIGDALSSISTREPLQFDAGDEMYYRVDEEDEYKPGLAVVAKEVPPEEFSSTGVSGFCVHDWSIYK